MMMRLHYFYLCLCGLPKAFVFSPLFTLKMTFRRLLFSLTRRFAGPPIISPITGETIFNVQSLINGYSMQIVGDLDGPWQEFLRETPNPTVFDVGSNMGQFRSFALSFNPTAIVYTFDPWLELSVFVPKEFHKVMALGSQAGSSTLHRAEALTKGTGWTASTHLEYWPESKVHVTVPMGRLDDEWNLLGRPFVDLLKIDVDGAELEVLKGAQTMLRETGCILIETGSLEQVKSLCPGRIWTTSNHYDYCGVLDGARRKTA